MEKLIETKHQDIEECLHKLEHWKKFKSDYEALQQRVSTLPDKLSHEIMVPFGPHAFMPGTLVNTNKITVFLGANWFTDMSAKQAGEFIQRRIQQCDRLMNCLQQEIEQHKKWLDFSMGVYVEKPIEIKEEYIPEKEAEWREQHRKNVRAYRQQMAKERQLEEIAHQASVDDDSRPNDDYFERLRELEIQEKSEPQETESPETVSQEKLEILEKAECQKTGSQETLGSQAQLELQKMCEAWEMFNYSTSDTEDDSQDSEDDVEDWKDDKEMVDERNDNRNSDDFNKNVSQRQDDNHQINDDQNSEKHNKHVRWIDLSEAKSKCITFTHSKLPATPHHHHKKKNKRKRRNSSTSEVEEEDTEDKNMPLINSPSDIYKCFSYSIQQSKPKSILKSSSSETLSPVDEFRNLKLDDNENNFSLEFDENKCPELEKNIHNVATDNVSRNLAFTGEIKEHFGKSTPEKIVPDKRKSLFKSSRRGVKT